METKSKIIVVIAAEVVIISNLHFLSAKFNHNHTKRGGVDAWFAFNGSLQYVEKHPVVSSEEPKNLKNDGIQFRFLIS